MANHSNLIMLFLVRILRVINNRREMRELPRGSIYLTIRKRILRFIKPSTYLIQINMILRVPKNAALTLVGSS